MYNKNNIIKIFIKIYFLREIHIVDDLKINILINNDIIKSKSINIITNKRIVIIENCEIIILIKIKIFEIIIVKKFIYL